MDNWNEFIKLYNSFQYQGIEKCHGTIYHYTSPESLQGIFETNSLFATDLYFLNDASEGMYVIKLIQDNIEKLCQNNKKLIKAVRHELRLLEFGQMVVADVIYTKVNDTPYDFMQ